MRCQSWKFPWILSPTLLSVFLLNGRSSALQRLRGNAPSGAALEKYALLF